MSILTAFMCTGVNSVSDRQYVISRSDATGNGMRMFFLPNGGYFNWSFGSSESAINPQSAGTTPPSYDGTTWYAIGGSHDGTINYSGLSLYAAANFNSLTVETLSWYSSGVGSLLDNASDQLHIGERAGSSNRSFKGHFAYAAWWDHILPLDEFRFAQRNGPLSQSNGLIFCFANGIDYGPYNLQPVSIGAGVSLGIPYPYCPLGSL